MRAPSDPPISPLVQLSSDLPVHGRARRITEHDGPYLRGSSAPRHARTRAESTHVRPPVLHGKHLRRTVAAALLTLATVAAAQTQPPPEPLTLAQALTYADGHPRVRAGNDTGLPARPQPIYLACHSLAFVDAQAGDQPRDVAWGPLLTPLAAQRLEIMQRFYDVLLADLSYMRDNEAMAVGYVQFDRARARSELGQYSTLAVAELEAAYQHILRQRAASDASRRLTRSLLAQALGTPADLPKTLVEPPRLPSTEAALPELDTVVATVLADNPRVRERLAAGDESADALITMAVRQQALELLLRLEVLAVAAGQTRIEADWRDLKLDESRTNYEMEVTADLGYAMSRQTKARRDEMAVALCRSLTLAELDALQGKPVLAASAAPVRSPDAQTPAQQPESGD